MLGKYSPTVHWSYHQDQKWHEKFLSCGGQYDVEGYDSYGYDGNGIDRAGYSSWDYADNENLYNAVMGDVTKRPGHAPYLNSKDELAKLKEAIRASGYGVLKESNGKWSIHDVSDKYKRELDREARMIGEHISMLHALKAIVAHDPATCNGITPSDCLEAVQEIARAAIKEVEDVK